MGEADLAHAQRRSALAQALELLAGHNASAGGAARHVTVGLDPRDRAHKTLLVVLVGLSESGGDLGELEIDHVGRKGELLQPFGEIGSTDTTPTPHCHEESIRTYVWTVKRKKS